MTGAVARLRRHAGRAAGAGLVAAAVVAGCGIGPSPLPSTPGARTATPSAAQATGGVPATTLAASPADPRPWGPLAIIPPQGGADTARLEGTLRITDACVFLDAGASSLLFWPADRVLWSPESRTITFRSVDGTRVVVGSGDRVAVGGSGDSTAESGIPGADWVKALAVVAGPDPSCSLDVRWVVGALSREG